MVAKQDVIIVANDVVPGQNTPVSGPGLRAFGLAEGLRAHGFEVTVIVPQHLQRRVWARWRSFPQPPTPPGTVVLRAPQYVSFLKKHTPVVVIFTNHIQIDHLRAIPGVTYIMDCFAPKLLEYTYTELDNEEESKFTIIRQKKLSALKLADAYIVNGKKKVPYYYGWILSSGKRLDEHAVKVVNMCLPTVASRKTASNQLRLGIAGYLQPWNRFGQWFDSMPRLLETTDISLHLLIPKNRGAKEPDAHTEDRRIEHLCQYQNVHVHDLMIYSDYCDFLSSLDVVLDLFEWTPEREYAMVTRTVAAICCGTPVIHPPFTEVSDFIAEYDAGWLADPDDSRVIMDILEAITLERGILEQKSSGARKMAQEIFSPHKAVAPLVELIEALRA